jgi:hypothetical protein
VEPRHTFNYAEMAALIAPRPFMVERGHFDGVAPDETVGYEFAKVRHLVRRAPEAAAGPLPHRMVRRAPQNQRRRHLRVPASPPELARTPLTPATSADSTPPVPPRKPRAVELAVIVAAGVGKRFGPGADKLFLEGRRPTGVAHTWARFDGRRRHRRGGPGRPRRPGRGLPRNRGAPCHLQAVASRGRRCRAAGFRLERSAGHRRRLISSPSRTGRDPARRRRSSRPPSSPRAKPGRPWPRSASPTPSRKAATAA